ncbi:glutaredoxin family protein [Streptomyces sp. NPDC059506]|uniref:Glutaredoxin family protein n=1 Tax=Streptomyces thermolineatus TaxID=44033 RepID=A0ABP5ZKN3_9ACTN|nr:MULTISPECIES: glutaredoxin family protein [unclassified Streptomyces]MCZ2524975.1 glutaredoxin family protein [Streptomyces sp. HB2AG]
MGRVSPLIGRRTRKDPARHEVTLITRPGCHLCHRARAVVEKVTAELGVPWKELDITRDEALYAEYWEKIPVTLVDGEQHGVWRVDEEKLRAALER